MRCRHCHAPSANLIADLGVQPPSNSYLQQSDLCKEEIFLPLQLYVCEKCFLVQIRDYTVKENFFTPDYAYFSSTSSTWLIHTQQYVREVITKFSLQKDSFVIEIGSNDGYLLQNFIKKQIPCLGIEPTESTARAARLLGVDTMTEFFDYKLAKKISRELGKADLVVCKNVYAHVPDVNDFTKGLEAILKNDGVVTVEFPHVLNLIHACQFDTVYHEHFSYFALGTVIEIFKKCGLRVFHAEKHETHGGSLRVYGCKIGARYDTSSSVKQFTSEEVAAGLRKLDTYFGFEAQVNRIKLDFLEFLIQAKYQGKRVCGYGAAAKASALLNYSGVKPDLLPFVADAAKSKIGRFLPGNRIPILAPSAMLDYEPDYVIIFPWNIAAEIKSQLLKNLRNDCTFFVALPRMTEI